MRDATIEPELTVTLTVSHPLRARDIVVFAQTASGYAAEITVKKHDSQADGKRYFALVELNAQPGDTLHIVARGDDASEAIDALKTSIVALDG